jgi:hypothetical protein
MHRPTLRRQRPPTAAVAEQDDEVGPRRHLLAALDLLQADAHGLLVERGLLVPVTPF